LCIFIHPSHRIYTTFHISFTQVLELAPERFGKLWRVVGQDTKNRPLNRSEPSTTSGQSSAQLRHQIRKLDTVMPLSTDKPKKPKWGPHQCKSKQQRSLCNDANNCDDILSVSRKTRSQTFKEPHSK
jgi:hypothetical protein